MQLEELAGLLLDPELDGIVDVGIERVHERIQGAPADVPGDVDGVARLEADLAGDLRALHAGPQDLRDAGAREQH